MVAQRFWKHVALGACVARTTLAAIFQAPAHLPTQKRYDYIVIGGGAAGSTLANRLTENPAVKLLLVEAGSSDYRNLKIQVPKYAPNLLNSQFDWNFTTAPQSGLNGRSIPFERGHVLGGSTSVNYMGFTRGSKDDWDRWVNITEDEGWSWDSILSYAKKMEHFVDPTDGRSVNDEVDLGVHGFQGPVHSSVAEFRVSTDIRVLNATKQLADEFPFNRDTNSGFTLGIGWQQLTIANGERQSAALSYLDPVLHRPNLDILVNTHVIKLVQTDTREGVPEFRAVHLSQSSSGKVYTLHATREIIVSAGAVKTPHLLMLSGIGDSVELSKLGINTIVHLPDVGHNLQDQPLVTSSFIVNSTNTLDKLNDANFAAEQLKLWEHNRTGALVLPAGNQLGWLRLPSNSTIFETAPDPSAGPSSGHFEFILSDGFIGFNGPPPTTGNFFTALTIVTTPTSRGSVSLNSTDPFDAPIINPGYLTSTFDIFAMREAIKALRRFMGAPAWSDWVVDEFGDFKDAVTDEELEAYIRNTAQTIDHVCGTVAMGRMEQREARAQHTGAGALNPDLTVKGTVGLRVVDASAFPFIPAGHTQVPTYILAERAADLIKTAKLV